MQRRTDVADDKTFFQSDRFFMSEGQWYFSTREGVDFGPYSIREDGMKACERYIETQRIMGRLRRRDPGMTDDSKWDNQDVANAAKDVSNWRLDRSSRPDSMYVDRSDKYK